jgi:hypothetical protein
VGLKKEKEKEKKNKTRGERNGQVWRQEERRMEEKERGADSQTGIQTQHLSRREDDSMAVKHSQQPSEEH